MKDAVIVGAVRTAVGRKNGKLASVRPDDLAARAPAGDGDPEVGHDRSVGSVLDHDVVGLDVPMHHAALVRVGERPGRLLHQPGGGARGERPMPLDPLPQRLAVHEAHHEEHPLAVILDDVDRHDVRMGEPGGGTCLAQKPLARRRVGCESRGQDLDRHRPVERHVARQQHDAHAAAAQLALDGVTAGEQLLQWQQGGVEHGHKERQRRGKHKA